MNFARSALHVARPRGVAVAAALALPALALAACSPAPESAVTLTAADSGSTVTLETGQTLVIGLDANHATGFSWKLDAPVPAPLEQSGEPAYEVASDRVGASGTETWIFIARSPGEATLTMVYARPFEADAEPAEQFEVTVHVR